MSLLLEAQIMEEIGFGHHYMWHSGSPGCFNTRIAAVKKLAGVIKKHADAGDPIATPSKVLLNLLNEIALYADHGQATLTKTWQACSDAIRAHMEAYGADRNKRRQIMKGYSNFMRGHYLRYRAAFPRPRKMLMMPALTDKQLEFGLSHKSISLTPLRGRRYSLDEQDSLEIVEPGEPQSTPAPSTCNPRKEN